MKKRILSLLLAALLALTFTACADKSAAETGALPTADRAGNAITPPEKVDTVIAMAPSIVEVLVDLGLGDKIVAVDSNSKDLPGIPEDVKVFDMMNPDAEQMASLAPDLVLASGMSQAGDSDDPYKPLRDAGVCTAYIPTSDTIEGIKNDVQFIADLTNTSEKGRELTGAMQAEIDRITAIGKTITDKKTVYFEVAAAPYIYSFGSGVYLNEMLELIGAENVFSGQTGWMSVTPEAAVQADADVILTNVDYIDDPVSEIKARDGWGDMKAVKNGDIYFINSHASSVPNHNIVKAMLEIAKAVYPEQYNQ